MLPAPMLANERQRLATLHAIGLLDTPPEERFDRITRTATRLLNVPMAMLVLVDAQREYFKSRQGLAVTEGPRTASFSGHALLAKDLFEIPDATKDPRFTDNPVVMFEPHVRFYAGIPLRAPDNSQLGVLCVQDQRPRQLSAVELESLRFLAAWAERELCRSLQRPSVARAQLRTPQVAHHFS